MALCSLKFAAPRGRSDAALIRPRPATVTGAPTGFREPAVVFFEQNRLPGGTNGYTTSWGTNAHGKLAGCPPRDH